MATNVQVMPRPMASTGLLSWIMTVDHKRIGILYLITALVFFILGGIEALLVRTQLGVPENSLLSPGLYNALFTMHGTTMIFLAIMPINTGFGNYIVPLMIGARDMAFPRLNALSYWLFLFGGLLLYASFIFGGAPDAGWFGYAPLTESRFSPGPGIDFWILSLQMLGISSLLGSLNFIVTILNLRAPGMSLNRMPLFVWGIFVTSLLIIFAIPSITVGLFLLLFDRYFGTSFFLHTGNGDPVLWQHLFWFFGHPEVYIMIMPAFGIISEVFPTFSRKPIFGYPVVAYATVAIAFLGFTVWAHHMFAVGLSPAADAVFAGASMLIAVPTGVKIFNWLATLWRGSIRINTAFLFAAGFIGQFTIGGLSGVALATVPVDWQVTDSYFVVAHLHYVLFAGAALALFAATYYWFPKMTGRLLNETLGRIHFILIMIGMTLAFFPMHFVGMLGMPRRIYTYAPGYGWDLWNLVETVGAYIVALGVLVFVINVLISLRSKAVAGNDPWDGQTLEWATTSPPPAYNFAKIPVVSGRRPVWELKYGEHGHAPDPKALAALSQPDTGHIHLPGPSYWPIVLAFGVALIAVGIIFNVIIVPVGVLVLAAGFAGWIAEPV